MFRKLSFNAGASKFCSKSVVLKRNQHGNFGFTVEGGLEQNCLPYVVLLVPESALLYQKGKLRDRAEILEVNGRVVAGDKLEHILRMIEMGKSDTIIISVLDSSSLLSKWKISQLLQSQKSSGKTAEYIEQIRCNIYDNTTPVTTRPPRKGEASGSNVHVTKEEFQKLVTEQRMLEWGESPTNGYLYGTMIPVTTDTTNLVDREPSVEAAEACSQETFTSNIVVLRRASYYDPWGFSLGGGVGSDCLPTVSTVAPGIHQMAWLTTPMAQNDAIIAVNGHLVAASPSSTILALLSKRCSCELTLATGSSGGPVTYSSVLGTRALVTATLSVLQQDVRDALFDSSVLHTTRAPFSEEAGMHCFVSDPEFSALAASNKLVAWNVQEDGVRRGVCLPLMVCRTVHRRSRLHALLRVQNEPLLTVPTPRNGAGLEFALLPGTSTLIVVSAPPDLRVQVGMAVRAIDGTRVRDPQAAAALVQRAPATLTLGWAFGEVAHAYADPVG